MKEIAYYLDVVSASSVFVEALGGLHFRDVQKRLESHFTLSYKVNVRKRCLGVFSDGLVKLLIFGFRDICWPKESYTRK